ncbi:19457_t:CDS:2 [Gigaspora margarita]|uniref:19457_t:CDS:1 n=1 Tax=Gigaspora margarita TaxID=4874 RepID=A0ABN7WMV0_GIGMA|nr:19457_t:CDS:2 [Gigaspora margarita]
MALRESPVQTTQQPLSVRKKAKTLKVLKKKLALLMTAINDKAQYERPLPVKKKKESQLEKNDSTNTGTNGESSTNDTTTIQLLPARKIPVQTTQQLIYKKKDQYVLNISETKAQKKKTKPLTPTPTTKSNMNGTTTSNAYK